MTGLPALVRHRYDAAKEVVTLRVRAHRSGFSEDYELSPAEAKRLAWGLLSDLDPEEAEAAGIPEPLAPMPGSAVGARRCTCGRAQARAPSGFAGRLLKELVHRRLTAREAGSLIDRDVSTASSFLCGLVRVGLAERVSGGLFNEPSVYDATVAGREAVAASMRLQP